MLWVQIIFFSLAVLVMGTNFQHLYEYRKSKRIHAAKRFPLKKWSLFFTTLLAAGVIISTLKEWISFN